MLVVYLIYYSHHINSNNLINNNLVDKLLCNCFLDLSRIFEFYHILFNKFSIADKKLFPLIIHYNLILLQLQENIAFNIFGVHHFQMIKQKAYLFPENRDQLSNLKIGFIFVILLLTDIYSSSFFF